ncbi:ubiE/COQ5 methyltransferase [Desmophyllum pertusum]|uniref:UbiE/COQ5 methyltransferase n=1 Tax=Desmophyllum pertusum TaxID=174260 RepID=A0A9X0CR83_9CNID|nr:ubiE/COQ5 methyltransferase [Desmophyllum pertusum]
MDDKIFKYYQDRLWLLTSESSTDDVIREYAEWAENYDKSMQEPNYNTPRPFAKLFDATVSKLFPEIQKKNFKVLDVAAGTGLLGLELNKLGYENIDALDMSQEMLSQARTKNVYKKLVCAAMTDQQITDIDRGEYDALTCSSAVCTSHVRPSAVEEMIKIVKPGGVVCFNISFVEVNSYEDKLKELEDTGEWRLALKEKIPFVRDKLTEESILYIYEREGKATDLQAASFLESTLTCDLAIFLRSYYFYLAN